MRVCFIGDSHLACIKKAWDAELAARYPAVSPTFFAAPGRGMDRLDVRDGTLGSEDPEVTRILLMISGGAERIDAAYDVYALHGMHLSVIQALDLLRQMPGVRGTSRPEFVATPEFRAELRSAIEGSIAVGNLRKLREITRAPAFVSPTPMADARMQPLRRRLVDYETAQPLADLFDEMCSLVCRDLDARFVPQPPQTRFGDGLATKAEYSLNAARFSHKAEQIVREDASHMNAQYGREAGAAILDAVARL